MRGAAMKDTIVDFILRPLTLEIPEFTLEYSDLLNHRTKMLLHGIQR